MELENKINNIKDLFNATMKELEKLYIDYTDSDFNRARNNMTEIYQLRDELKSDYPFEELQKYDQELVILAKQIGNTYDNIIGKYIEERNILSEKLKSVQNKKKIANYSR